MFPEITTRCHRSFDYNFLNSTSPSPLLRNALFDLRVTSVIHVLVLSSDYEKFVADAIQKHTTKIVETTTDNTDKNRS